MDDFSIAIISGIIGVVGSIIGGYVGAKLGSRFEANTRWKNRPRLSIIQEPVIDDKKWQTYYLDVKNIGKTTARGCIMRELISEQGGILMDAEILRDLIPGDAGELHPMQTASVSWIRFNQLERTIIFPGVMNPKEHSIKNLHPPLSCKLTAYAVDAEPEHVEFDLILRENQIVIIRRDLAESRFRTRIAQLFRKAKADTNCSKEKRA